MLFLVIMWIAGDHGNCSLDADDTAGDADDDDARIWLVIAVVLFSVVSVCVSVCLSVCPSVCQHDNSGIVRDISTKFSGRHPTVVTVRKIENGCIWMRVWWFDVSGVVVSLKKLSQTLRKIA